MTKNTSLNAPAEGDVTLGPMFGCGMSSRPKLAGEKLDITAYSNKVRQSKQTNKTRGIWTGGVGV